MRQELINSIAFLFLFIEKCHKRIIYLLLMKRGEKMKKIRNRRFLKYEDRKLIEKMYSDGERVVIIAEKIGVHRATIYKELKRGGTPYNADVAQRSIG